MANIIYTITDEAPALATRSFLPIVKSFVKSSKIGIDTSNERLDFDILEDYIKWLNVSDKMMELPRKNHLLAMPELLKQ